MLVKKLSFHYITYNTNANLNSWLVARICFPELGDFFSRSTIIFAATVPVPMNKSTLFKIIKSFLALVTAYNTALCTRTRFFPVLFFAIFWTWVCLSIYSHVSGMIGSSTVHAWVALVQLNLAPRRAFLHALKTVHCHRLRSRDPFVG